METSRATPHGRNVSPFLGSTMSDEAEVGLPPFSSSYSELKWPSDHLPLDRFTSPSPLEEEEEAVKVAGSLGHNSSVGGVHSTTDEEEEEYTFANLPPVLEPDKTALLVVDVQPEYWSQCDAVRKDFPHFPRRMEATVAAARAAGVARILWVRADYRYSHSPWLKQFSRIHGKNKKNFRAEVPCDNLENPSEFDWESFATPNVQSPNEIILPKTSWSSTSNAQLMDILETSNIDTVLVCGLITSVCVQHSAFGVFEAGYRTLLVHDACADRGRARHEAALALYADYMYTTVSSTDLPQLWSPSASSTSTAVAAAATSVVSANIGSGVGGGGSSSNMEKSGEGKTNMTTATSFTSLASQDATVTSGSSSSPEEEDEVVKETMVDENDHYHIRR